MRHKYNKLLQVNTGAKSKSVFMRMQLSSLLRAGKLTTTPKRAKVLKMYTDEFFSTLLNISAKYEEKDVDKVLNGEIDGFIYAFLEYSEE